MFKWFKRLKVNKSEMVVFTDIDDTLLLWSDKFDQPGEDKIRILDPYDQTVLYLTPHHRHINLIKSYKERGYYVIAWSANGWKWAEAAIKALKLDAYVDQCMSKSIKYVDDLKSDNILGQRVYIPVVHDGREIK